MFIIANNTSKKLLIPPAFTIVPEAISITPAFATNCVHNDAVISVSYTHLVSALSVISPYFVKLTDSELYEHFKTVAESVNVPVILYNIPRMTGNPISKEVFRKLATVKNIAGIKDSSRDLDNLKNYIEVAKAHDLKVLVGSDGIIMDGYKMGASGAIAGMSLSLIHI